MPSRHWPLRRPEGMVDGQSLDLLAEGLALERSQLEQIHRRKPPLIRRLLSSVDWLAKPIAFNWRVD